MVWAQLNAHLVESVEFHGKLELSISQSDMLIMDIKKQNKEALDSCTVIVVKEWPEFNLGTCPIRKWHSPSHFPPLRY